MRWTLKEEIGRVSLYKSDNKNSTATAISLKVKAQIELSNKTDIGRDSRFFWPTVENALLPILVLDTSTIQISKLR